MTFPADSFLDSRHLTQIPPQMFFRRLIGHLLHYGSGWLVEQMNRLQGDKEAAATFIVLDSPRGLERMTRDLLIHHPTLDIKSHLNHINAEYHAAQARAEAQYYKEMAQKNKSLYQKLKKNITKALEK